MYQYNFMKPYSHILYGFIIIKLNTITTSARRGIFSKVLQDLKSTRKT